MSLSKRCILELIATILLMNALLLNACVTSIAQSRPGVASDRPLTLRQALDIALYSNRLISISGLQVEQAKQRVAQARTDLLPQFNV